MSDIVPKTLHTRFVAVYSFCHKILFRLVFLYLSHRCQISIFTLNQYDASVPTNHGEYQTRIRPSASGVDLVETICLYVKNHGDNLSISQSPSSIKV